jgi:trans-aconitate methyltransferase
MAALFEQVLALDVAPAMLNEARRNARTANCANIDFAQSDDVLSAAQGHFDFVLSCIVFQHIPVKRGMAILRVLLGRVAEGGVIALQICIDRGDTPLQALRYWAQLHVPGYQIVHNLTRGRMAGDPLMQMNAYCLHAILTLASELGFGPAVVESHFHGRFLTAEILMRREPRFAD